MSDATVIKDFLVSLGFQIDASSSSKFSGVMRNITLEAAALGSAVVSASIAVTAAVEKIASGMESLYFASLRTKASVENIQALGFAAGQMGSTADGARGSLEALGRFMRTNPGSLGFISSLGVQTKDAAGNLRDTSEIMMDLGERFKSMPYYLAKAYADTIGIDERTLMAMQQGMGEFGQQYKAMLRAAGLDSQAAAKSSHDFMNEVRTLGSALSILAQKVATTLSGSVGENLRHFRELLVDNFARISNAIEKVLTFVNTLADAVAAMVMRGVQVVEWLVDAWNGLDETTKSVIKSIGLLGIAWLGLNAIFAASPIGIVLGLGAAVLALWDDYKVWRDGGKSLINWANWKPEIEWATNAVNILGGAVKAAFEWIEKLSSKYLSGTKLGDLIGSATAHLFALGGNKEAQAAISQNEAGASATPAAPATKGPRGLRNNNPGNIEYGPFAKSMGATGSDGRFAIFPTPAAGLQALSALLRGYGKKGFNTLKSAINRYAPSSENNTPAYVKAMANELGVSPDAALDMSDPTTLAAMMRGITKHENGSNPYSGEMIAAAAGARPGAPGAPVVHQQTTITVNGATDPARTAAAIGTEQSTVNSRLVRDMKGAAS